jgi:hypothetical protein
MNSAKELDLKKCSMNLLEESEKGDFTVKGRESYCATLSTR